MAQRVHWSTVWGIGGYLGLLGSAVFRLSPLALAPIRSGELLAWQWVVMIAFVLFMLYSEGYRGFWKQVGPRVAGRGLHLRNETRPIRRILAPFFCMSLFGATRKRMIVSWCVYTGIIGLIIAVRQIDQPYRGMIDAGVVVGLAMGWLSVVYFTIGALHGRPLPVPTDVAEAD